MLIMALKVMEQLLRLPSGVPQELCEQIYNTAHYFAVEHNVPPSEALFVQIVIVMVRVGICEPHLAERVFGCLLDWIPATSPVPRELLYQACLRGIAELAACYPTKLHKISDPLRDFVLYTNQPETVRDEAVTALCTVLRLEMTTHGVEIPRQLINSLFNLLHPSMHYSTPTSPPQTPAVSQEELHRVIINLLGRITCALDDPKVYYSLLISDC